MTPELIRAADDCPLLIQARLLAEWVGAGRPVTPKGVLRPADVPAAAEAMGVTVGARIRSAVDVTAVHRPWVAAVGLGWLTITAKRAVSAPAADGDPLSCWWTAVHAVLRAESHDAHGRGALILCRALLAAPRPVTLRDALADADLDDYDAASSAFREGAVPATAALEFLAEAGAVDGAGQITELGRWLLERLTEELPSRLPPEATAAVLLDRVAGLDAAEAWKQASAWLTARDPGAAAGDLLAAAAVAAPAQRIAAIDLVEGLGDVAEAAWRQVADVPILAPHARSALAGFDEEISDADRSWFAVEYALAALATDGAEEAHHVLREGGVLEAASTHPGEPELRAALAELIAAGGPPVPAYQLKITLSRLRTPVWRRVQLPATTRLDELHHVIQIAFDWDGDHLHLFTVDGRRYADPFAGLDGCADESGVRLGRLAPRPGTKLTYLYDLGAGWQHEIVVERIIGASGPELPAICIAGSGDAPVEDWHPEHGPDSTPFDLDAINKRLSGDLDDSR